MIAEKPSYFVCSFVGQLLYLFLFICELDSAAPGRVLHFRRSILDLARSCCPVCSSAMLSGQTGASVYVMSDNFSLGRALGIPRQVGCTVVRPKLWWADIDLAECVSLCSSDVYRHWNFMEYLEISGGFSIVHTFPRFPRFIDICTKPREAVLGWHSVARRCCQHRAHQDVVVVTALSRKEAR